jgi:hypothetical protein
MLRKRGREVNEALLRLYRAQQLKPCVGVQHAPGAESVFL